MPTYEYSCQKCGLEFELVQSMKDAPLTTCTCGKKGKVRRKIGGGAGIIFKGTGFYETDYRRSGSKSSGADSAPSAAPAKPDSKPPAAPAKPSSQAAS